MVDIICPHLEGSMVAAVLRRVLGTTEGKERGVVTQDGALDQEQTVWSGFIGYKESIGFGDGLGEGCEMK